MHFCCMKTKKTSHKKTLSLLIVCFCFLVCQYSIALDSINMREKPVSKVKVMNEHAATAATAVQKRKDSSFSTFAALFDVPLNLWPPTREIIADPSPELQQTILSRRIVYLTFGHNCCEMSKKRACDSFHRLHTDSICIAAGDEDIDDDFKERNKDIFASSRGYAYFVWKPYLINKTLHDDSLMRENDYLVYMDAGAYLQSPIHPLLVLLEKQESPILTFGVGLQQSNFCKRDAFVRQKCDTDECHNAMQVNAAFMVFRKDAVSKEFAGKWLADSSDFATISDNANVEGLPDLSGFVSHRHDQAVITNVLTRDRYVRDTTNGPATFMIVHDRDKS